MAHRSRTATVLILGVVCGLLGIGWPGQSAQAAAPTASARPQANSHWVDCDHTAVRSAPAVVWQRIEAASTGHNGLPADFWTDPTYRRDLTKIICYESSFDWHADGGGQYGWYQMSKPLIADESVSWNQYWDGTKSHQAGYFQCVAGERYVVARYGNPAAAWQHEGQYGWY